MEQNAIREVFLTFDVEGPPRNEDCVNTETIIVLHRVLKLLQKYRLKGLFFITGSTVIRLAAHQKIMKLLQEHEIGYHSATHSTKPRIFEYTDVQDYARAVEISRTRETSTVNPRTQSLEGEGGILLLRKTFPNKEITAFRAPFLCWSPPHLEALRELGFKFDFSADFCSVPVLHRGITFYPAPIAIDGLRDRFIYADYQKYHWRAVLKAKPLTLVMLQSTTTVLLSHPASLAFTATVPSQMYYQNAHQDSEAFEPKRWIHAELSFFAFESMIAELSFLNRIGSIEVTPRLEESRVRLNPQTIDINETCEPTLKRITRLFGYNPKFLLAHLQAFLADSD